MSASVEKFFLSWVLLKEFKEMEIYGHGIRTVGRMIQNL